ncbi:MAG: erythronate-4-phosphate dehydrogenase, partial [Bacteroidaceae bacterium]|nr:erythronate-4-phosphate dehydrogenase [Bacteroidaceae bacterium]
MRIIIDDKIPFIREAATQLGEAVYLSGSDISAADVRDADALIVRTRTRCDEALLQGSRVQMVATATIGYDHIDTAYMQRAGVAWTNCPGCNADSVAQYVQSALI